MADPQSLVLQEIEVARDELVEFAAALIRIPTVNPPGREYLAAADFISKKLAEFGMEVERFVADSPDPQFPRVNTVGRLPGTEAGPCVHFNGHIDVVPPGQGWTIDPFEGLIRDGKLLGRGSADMKAGLAAAVFAVEAIRRSGVTYAGSLEISATVDEESGGQAGVAHLAEVGRISADRIDHVIIPEPFGIDRICLGHRGVYWFRVTAHGKIAHGSMPFLGTNAIDRMQDFIHAMKERFGSVLESRITDMPVVPEAARRATLNINAIEGGQTGEVTQTPCVPDRCVATFDRRFLPEESFDDVRREIQELVENTGRPDARFELEDLLVVKPTFTDRNSPLIQAFERAVGEITGRTADLVASPGTYDHKHVTRIAGINSCIAYGPGILEQAHQVDEWCDIEAIVLSAKVMASAALELLAGR